MKKVEAWESVVIFFFFSFARYTTKKLLRWKLYDILHHIFNRENYIDLLFLLCRASSIKIRVADETFYKI